MLEQSLSTISPHARAALLIDIVNFPLPDESGIIDSLRTGEWPEPIDWFSEKLISRPEDDVEFANRVKTLIEKTRTSGSDTRGRAARRLGYLHLNGALTANESKG